MKRYLALVLAIALSLSMVVGLTGCAKKGEGSVYFLNFKPEADQAWQDLAAKYYELTGVEVKVVTAASGTYNDVLTAEMDKENPPTLFQCGNAGALKTWGEFCYDLSDTDFYKQMTTDDFNLYGENGELLAAGYCYEAFGIIVNKTLLKQAGYEVTDITDFASLKTIADDIHARASELGFDAFSAAGLDGSSSWRFSGHLANMPLFYQFRDDGVEAQPATINDKYLDNYKNIWDLYTTDSATTGAALLTSTGDESKAQFGNREAVFYQNGTWEYTSLVEDFGLAPEELTMIPIYCGVEGEENAALCCGTENCWSVNKTVPQEDIDATLDFMEWVVTSDEGTTLMAEQFGPCPFKKAKEPDNVFFADANKYIAEGKYVVTWAFNYTPAVEDWRAGVVDSLSKYVSGTGDWTAVVDSFVNGWAAQYQAENEG